MRVFFNKSFFRAFSRLGRSEQEAVKSGMDSFMSALDGSRAFPQGLGLRHLRPSHFEIRAGLALRVLFSREKDVLTWLFVGNHDEIRKFLKRL
jgi:hypothetical protein